MWPHIIIFTDMNYKLTNFSALIKYVMFIAACSNLIYTVLLSIMLKGKVVWHSISAEKLVKIKNTLLSYHRKQSLTLLTSKVTKQWA